MQFIQKLIEILGGNTREETVRPLFAHHVDDAAVCDIAFKFTHLGVIYPDMTAAECVFGFFRDYCYRKFTFLFHLWDYAVLSVMFKVCLRC